MLDTIHFSSIKTTIFRVLYRFVPFRTMIDINLLRVDKGGNPELVKSSQRKRGGEKAVELVDHVIALDDEWKKGK